jgi:Predicted membrane protein (DUF2207)
MNFRHCLRLAVSGILAVAGQASATGPVWHVNSLKAKVIVNSDASLSVDETLIIPENADPNFGLRCEIPIGDDDRWDREFGPGYTEDNGLRLKIQRVVVDGAPAEYRLDHSLHHFHQVIMGRGNRWTSFGPGAHELNVVYQVTGALRAVGADDELYWNVAGHSLPIAYDSVSARVYLPDGAGGDSLQISSYEGGRGVTAARMRSGMAIESTKLRDGAEFSVGDVGPHESLTIVLRWPQGFVHRPTTREKYFSAFYFSPVILLLFYIASRLYLRRDVAPYSTAPQYEPPQGLSPAALRYVMRGSVDGTSVAASLASLAVQGYVQVETKGASYRFRRTQKCDSGLDKLPAEQKAIAELMFDPSANVADAACGTRNDFHDEGIARQVASDQKWADSVTFGPSDPRVNVLVGTIYSRVKPQLDGKYFTWNAGIVFFAMLATLIFAWRWWLVRLRERDRFFWRCGVSDSSRCSARSWDSPCSADNESRW